MGLQASFDNQGAGVTPGAGVYGNPTVLPVSFPQTNLTVRNVGTVAGQIAFVDFDGNQSPWVTIPVGGVPVTFECLTINQILLQNIPPATSGAAILVYCSWPGKVTFTFANGATPIIFSGGQYTGGDTPTLIPGTEIAPMTGLWYFTVQAIASSNNIIEDVTVNGGFPLTQSMSMNEDGSYYEVLFVYPVVAGMAYSVAVGGRSTNTISGVITP